MEAKLKLEGPSVEGLSIKALGDVAFKMKIEIDQIYMDSTPDDISKDDLHRLASARELADKLAGLLLRIGR